MKACSFFTGIGGFDLGFERSEIKTVLQCEIDANCLKLLLEKFPDAIRLSDIRAIASVWYRMRMGLPVLNYEHWKKIFELLSSADVWCGGFPCQDLSVAGQRTGLAGGRSGLWFSFRRLIALFRPPWVVIENVPGLLSSNKGVDLATVLSGLAQCGYRWAYRILDAQYLGLAQRRERVFIVASLGNWRCAEVLFERESVCGDSAPSRETGQRVAPVLEGRAGRSGSTNFHTSGGLAEIAGTLGTNERGGHQTTDLDGTGAFIPILEVSKGTTSRGQGPNGCGIGEAGDPMFTLQRGAQHAVAFTERTRSDGRNFETQEELAYALTNPAAGGRSHSRSIAERAGVRRLTPTECERLQGFPDGWTEGFSDSVRYRMLGNAVAVPVAQWIGKRLVEQK